MESRVGKKIPPYTPPAKGFSCPDLALFDKDVSSKTTSTSNHCTPRKRISLVSNWNSTASCNGPGKKNSYLYKINLMTCNKYILVVN